MDPTSIVVKFDKNEIYDNDPDYEFCVDDLTVNDNDYVIAYRITEKICMTSKSFPNKYHKYCGFNKFTKETFYFDEKWCDFQEIVTDDYDDFISDSNYIDFDDYLAKRLCQQKKMILESVCDPAKKLFIPNPDIDSKVLCHDWTCYKTMNNGAHGYYVFIDDRHKNVYVYGRSNNVNSYDERMSELIATYQPLEIFIGKSLYNEMTQFSGSYGADYDGNSILLRIGHETEFKYLSIGTDIFEFTTDEKILEYYSSVGNNQVPYPYAESKNWCYDILSHYKIQNIFCENHKLIGHIFLMRKEYCIYFDVIEINDSYGKLYEKKIDESFLRGKVIQDTMIQNIKQPNHI